MKIGAFYAPRSARKAKAVSEAIERRGHELIDLVQSEARPDAAYIRTFTVPPWRERTINALREMTAMAVPTVPAPCAVQLYDDKAAQVAALAPWLPATDVIRSAERAESMLERMAYPFISKSRQGASSRNVRLIRSAEQARKEIALAFGPGIEAKYETQRGYLIWQEFIEGNAGDVRVCIAGDSAFGIERGNRDAVPFASGSGRLKTIAAVDTARRAQAFRMADEIAAALNSRWCCFDFVFRGERAYCLEVSFSWVEKAYDACPLFDRALLEPIGRTAEAWADLVVDELERA